MFASFQLGTHNCTVLIQGLILFCERQHVLNSMFLKYSYLWEQIDSSLTRIPAQRMNTHTLTHGTWTRQWVGMIGLAVCHYGCLADHMFSMVTHWLFPYANTHTARSSVCASKPSAAGDSLKLNWLLLQKLNQGEGKNGVKVRKYCLQPILLWESD